MNCHNSIKPRVHLTKWPATAWGAIECWVAIFQMREYFHRISLNESKRVIGLRVDVDADDIETGSVIAHSSTASATEQVE